MNPVARCSMALCLLALFGLPATSPCATFVVNSVQDGADMDSLDNVCDDGTGNCTLRAAIMQSNATLGADLIAFNIPEGVYHSISPTTDLPNIYDPVVIDGYTQPGSSPNTRPFGQAPCRHHDRAQPRGCPRRTASPRTAARFAAS
jgi:hypothetical protein